MSVCLRYFVLSSIVCLASHGARWTERIEVPIKDHKISGNFIAESDSELSFENEYGNIRVVVTEDAGNQFFVTGPYSSESPRHATLQYLVDKKRGNRLFVDGPALFKSHDHVAKYGKPLDYEFFESNIGKIPHIEVGDEPGEIKIGAFTLRPNGMSLSGRTVIWGPASFGGETKIHEGMSISKEPASADLIFSVPIQLIGKLDLKVEDQSSIEISFARGIPSNYRIIRRENDPTRATVERIDRPCAKSVAQ